MQLALSPWPESCAERAHFFEAMQFKDRCEEERTHDLNMSVQYASAANSSFPCIVCSSSIYMIERGRMASWWECMRLQGYPVHRLDHLFLSQHHGMELAGNAFNGFVIPPLITAAFILDPGIAIASIEPVLLSTQITPTASLSLHPVSSDSEQECGEESGLGSDEGEESEQLD